MSKGQIEDQLSKELTRFYLKTLGVGPSQSRTYIIEDMIIIRLKSKLLPVEQKLLEGHRGVELVKDIRQALHENTVHGVVDLVNNITGSQVISSHSDISTKTGEIFQAYIVNENLEERLRKQSGKLSK
jgi:uncharacterized protein YbcI